MKIRTEESKEVSYIRDKKVYAEVNKDLSVEVIHGQVSFLDYYKGYVVRVGVDDLKNIIETYENLK